MDFKDPIERETVLGPLFATEAKAAIPLFGPDRLASKHTKSIIDAAVKKALEKTADVVIDLTAPEDNMATETSNGHHERLGIFKNAKENSDGTDAFAAAPSLLSSQELHDKSYYSSSTPASTPSKYNLMVNTMIRRAKDGYLLNATHNKAIVQEDQWLHDVWDWIEGKIHRVYLSGRN